MNGNVSTVVAAFIGSLPAWTGLYLANRQTMKKQTEDIKRHVTETVRTKEKTDDTVPR